MVQDCGTPCLWVLNSWVQNQWMWRATVLLWDAYWSICCLVPQSCPTLYDSMDCSPAGNSVHRILQAGILEWVAFSRGSFWPGVEPMSLALAGRFFTTEPLWKPSTVIFIDSILLSTGVQKFYPRAFSHPMQWSRLSPGVVYVHVCVCVWNTI